jgi:hypothetical protein
MPHEAFKNYREEDRHECTLLTSRVNALIWSQSLFLAAWAVLRGNSDITGVRPIMILIPALAMAICLFAFVAILMSCRILRKWHRHGQQLIEHDLEKPESNRLLTDFHLKRRAPDVPHFVSIDVFSLAMPIVFTVFWICTILHTVRIESK